MEPGRPQGGNVTRSSSMQPFRTLGSKVTKLRSPLYVAPEDELMEKFWKPHYREIADRIGELTKQGRDSVFRGSKWERRFCLLKDDLLFYFKKKEDEKPIGVMILHNATISKESSHDHKPCISITVPESHNFSSMKSFSERTYNFLANSDEDLEEWMHALAVATQRTSGKLPEVRQSITRQNFPRRSSADHATISHALEGMHLSSSSSDYNLNSSTPTGRPASLSLLLPETTSSSLGGTLPSKTGGQQSSSSSTTTTTAAFPSSVAKQQQSSGPTSPGISSGHGHLFKRSKSKDNIFDVSSPSSIPVQRTKSKEDFLAAQNNSGSSSGGGGNSRSNASGNNSDSAKSSQKNPDEELVSLIAGIHPLDLDHKLLCIAISPEGPLSSDIDTHIDEVEAAYNDLVRYTSPPLSLALPAADFMIMPVTKSVQEIRNAKAKCDEIATRTNVAPFRVLLNRLTNNLESSLSPFVKHAALCKNLIIELKTQPVYAHSDWARNETIIQLLTCFRSLIGNLNHLRVCYRSLHFFDELFIQFEHKNARPANGKTGQVFLLIDYLYDALIAAVDAVNRGEKTLYVDVTTVLVDVAGRLIRALDPLMAKLPQVSVSAPSSNPPSPNLRDSFGSSSRLRNSLTSSSSSPGPTSPTASKRMSGLASLSSASSKSYVPGDPTVIRKCKTDLSLDISSLVTCTKLAVGVWPPPSSARDMLVHIILSAHDTLRLLGSLQKSSIWDEVRIDLTNFRKVCKFHESPYSKNYAKQGNSQQQQQQELHSHQQQQNQNQQQSSLFYNRENNNNLSGSGMGQISNNSLPDSLALVDMLRKVSNDLCINTTISSTMSQLVKKVANITQQIADFVRLDRRLEAKEPIHDLTSLTMQVLEEMDALELNYIDANITSQLEKCKNAFLQCTKAFKAIKFVIVGFAPPSQEDFNNYIALINEQLRACLDLNQVAKQVVAHQQSLTNQYQKDQDLVNQQNAKQREKINMLNMVFNNYGESFSTKVDMTASTSAASASSSASGISQQQQRNNSNGNSGNATSLAAFSSLSSSQTDLSSLFSDEGIVFGEEVSDGESGGAVRPVKAATLNKLVERLTYESHPDPQFTTAFLLTYRSFTDPHSLLELLIARYNIAPPDTPNLAARDKYITEHIIPVRLRVFNAIKLWINSNWDDFKSDPTLGERLKTFLEIMSKDLNTAAQHLQRLLDKKYMQGDVSRRMVTNSGKIPTPIINPNIRNSTQIISILDVDPLELARQMTVIDWRDYQLIQPKECLDLAWTKNQRELAPHILGMIEHATKLSFWVSTAILEEDTPKVRAKVMSHFFATAEKCRFLNNFNGIMAILAGMHNAAVHRLKKTWEALPNKIRTVYNELTDLMSEQGNFAKYRSELHSVDPPCIPFLGIYLTDLVMIESGNKNFLKGTTDMINFDKRRKIAAVIQEIQQYQQTPYFLQDVPPLIEYLENVKYMESKDEMYERSLLVEPRDGANRTQAATISKASTLPRKLKEI